MKTLYAVMVQRARVVGNGAESGYRRSDLFERPGFRRTAHDPACSPSAQLVATLCVRSFRQRPGAASVCAAPSPQTLRHVLRHDCVAAIPGHTPTLWDGLESRVPQRRGGVSAEPRTISRAALQRTGLPSAPDVCRVRAEPQNRPSFRVVRRRDLQPGDGVPRQEKQRGEVPNGTIDSQHAAGDPAACIESPATPADQNGRRPHKGRRLRHTAGNPAVRFDPQQPRLTKTGGAHEAMQTFH